MTLEEFVRESLEQIVKGACAAANSVTEHGALVNPSHHIVEASKLGGFVTGDRSRMAFPVEFDVAVTASEEVGSQLKIGVVAGFLGAGGSGKESETSARVSRIKFSVFLALPVSKAKGSDY